jgi:hypothetical protein
MSKDAAFKTALRKIWPADGDSSAILAGHLLSEALLFRFVQRNVANPAPLDDTRWTYRETLTLAQCLRAPKRDEDWLWETLRCLNNIRNRLAHDIDVPDLSEQIQKMYQAAGEHIDIHAPDADPEEREADKLKYFLLILCGVVQSLQDAKAEI